MKTNTQASVTLFGTAVLCPSLHHFALGAAAVHTRIVAAARTLLNSGASRVLLFSLCAWFGLSGLALGQAAGPANPDGPDDYAPGELLIKFNAGAGNAQVLDAWERAGLGLIKSIKLRDPKHPGITHVSTRLGVPQALRRLANHPAIEYAEPNYKIYPSAFPNDPLFPDLWGLHNTGGSRSVADADIDAPEAWDITTGSSDVLIGVVDTGIDINHVDLAANIWTNPGEIPNDGIDNDGNGYIDDVNGWDFWNGDNTVFDPADGDVHGTRVAGIIGASGNNGIGVVGVNWQSTIVPLKFIGPEFGYFSGAIQAVNYAAAKGVKVLNGSFGRNSSGPGDVGQGLKDAIQASGILFVAAAGNDKKNSDTTPFYPATYDLDIVIAVAATTREDKLAQWSNYGATSVDLGAPGAAIVSTTSGSHYGTGAGTSFAAPYVSGVAGLIYARFPWLTPTEVKARILAGVDPLSSLNGKTVTGGRLNAAKALVSLDSPPSVAITSPVGGAFVEGLITLSATASDPDGGVTEVSFYLDGSASLLGTDSNAPYEMSWDSLTADDGVHSIVAVATDTTNNTASHMVNVVVDNFNDPPIANAGEDQTIPDLNGDGFETVTLDAVGSFDPDPDGSIVSYEWTENGILLGTNSTEQVDVLVGTSTFTLTVTDNEGAIVTDTVQITVIEPPSTLHSGDLDGASATQGKNWWATVVVTIHDANDIPVNGATVSIQWSGGFSGTDSLTTDANGQCSFASGLINKQKGSTTLTITNVTHATLIYDAAVNHDSDGDSNGTSITVTKP